MGPERGSGIVVAAEDELLGVRGGEAGGGAEEVLGADGDGGVGGEGEPGDPDGAREEGC